MEKPRLRFGLIGAGFGARVHLPALRLCPEAELTGAVARTAQSRAVLEAAAPGLPLFDDVRGLLGLGLDGVICAVPPGQSPEIIEAALSVGCGVFAEKPLTASPDMSRRLAAMATAAGVPNTVNYSYLGLDLFQRLKRMIDEKPHGDLRTVQLRWTVESLAQKNRFWNWKTDANAGGGVFTSIGCHFVAVLCHLLGEPLRHSVFASNRATSIFAPPGASAAADTASWISEHANGVQVSGLLSNASPGEPCLRWEFVFDRATAVVACAALDYYSRMTLTIESDGRREVIAEPQVADEPAPQRATRMLLRSFIAQYAEGGRGFSDFSFGEIVDRWVAASHGHRTDS